MKITVKAIRLNRDTEQEEQYDLTLYRDHIACLYRDRYGVAITTLQGKFYRVDSTLEELRELI